MRRVATLFLIVLATAGCGGAHPAATPTTTAKLRPRSAAAGLHIGVVGELQVSVPGAVVEHGSLDSLADDPLVVVSASTPAGALVEAAATSHPVTHYALVGASVAGHKLPNLAGLVLRDDEAARLGGIVAGLVVAEQPAPDVRVAWVGPVERPLANAFVRGVHDIAPGTIVLRAWSRSTPAACKEAALGAIERGATVVMAHRGTCASAAIAGAHQQNHPGLQISDFELPDVVAAQVVRDAVAGVYHGGEDVVFGAASGAIAVRQLDPLISAATAIRARAAAQQLASGLQPSG